MKMRLVLINSVVAITFHILKMSEENKKKKKINQNSTRIKLKIVNFSPKRICIAIAQLKTKKNIFFLIEYYWNENEQKIKAEPFLDRIDSTKTMRLIEANMSDLL